MHLRFTSGLAAFSLILVACSSTPGTVAPSGTGSTASGSSLSAISEKSYTDPLKHFTVRYPSNWQTEAAPGANGGHSVQLYPSKNALPRVSIVSEVSDTQQSIADIAAESLASVKTDFIVTELREEDAMLGGQPAKKQSFLFTQTGLPPLRATILIAKKGNIVLSMALSDSPDQGDYTEGEAFLDRMAANIVWGAAQ